MDALLVIGSTMLAAVVVFFIWVLLSDARALKRSSVTPTNEMATGSTAQPGGSEGEYGSADCFYDCMRAFHWEAKEESPCASACGLKA